MFTALIESRALKSRNQFGTASSAVVHLGLIVLAVSQLRRDHRHLMRKDPPIKIRWIDKLPHGNRLTSTRSNDSHPSSGRTVARPSSELSIPTSFPRSTSRSAPCVLTIRGARYWNGHRRSTRTRRAIG